jgi:hypothetical protein
MIERSAVLFVRLDQETKDILTRMAAENERTVSGEVRRLVKAAAATELSNRRELEGGTHDRP